LKVIIDGKETKGTEVRVTTSVFETDKFPDAPRGLTLQAAYRVVLNAARLQESHPDFFMFKERKKVPIRIVDESRDGMSIDAEITISSIAFNDRMAEYTMEFETGARLEIGNLVNKASIPAVLALMRGPTGECVRRDTTGR